MKIRLKNGALDEIAREIGARTDKDLAGFLGVTEKQLETIRYQGLGVLQYAELIAKREAHLKAAELFNPNQETPAA